IQRHHREPRFAVLVTLKAHYVLVPLGTGLQFQAVLAGTVVFTVDVYFGIFALFAGKTFRGPGWGADRRIALAGNHIAVTPQRLFIECGHLVPGIAGGIGNSPYAQLPLAKAQRSEERR